MDLSFQTSNANVEGLWITTLVLLGIGTLFFLHGFGRLRLKRRVRALATSKIRSLAMGTIEVAGVARLDTNLIDPIYLQPCSYYHIKVEQERGSGKNRHWATIYEKNTNGIPFYCQDATGRVLIVPDAPETFFGNTIRRSSGSMMGFSDVSDAPILFMKSKGSGNLRLAADILRDGDPLYVTGFAQNLPNEMRPGAGVPLREAAEKLKKDREKMKLADTNQDGQIDAVEWENAVSYYKKELDAENSSSHPVLDNPIFTSNAFVSKGPGVSLVLANDEEDLISKLGWSAFLEVVGGGGLIVAGIAFLLKLITP